MNKQEKLDNHKNPVTATVHGLSHDGRGVGIINQKTAFISGALAGETVEFQIKQKRSSYIEADATNILISSASRVTPPCKHFGLCGGCSLQHMSMATQIELKQQTLIDQLKHFGKVTAEEIMPVLDAASLGYRRKARLGVKFVIKKDKLMVGFREKSSRYLADLESCVVLHPEVGMRFKELSALIASLKTFNHIPQVEMAMGDSKVALVFRHMQDLPAEDIQALIAFGQQFDFDIYLQPNNPQPVSKLWPKDGRERLSYTLPAEKLEFLFHPLDFTQVNLEINRQMVSQAMALLDVQPNERVLDLFCGIGNFTLACAKRGEFVTGIEGGAEMVSRAEENARHNGINNVEYFAANLEKPPLDAPWTKKQYDKILLDPPRVGAKDILALVPSFQAKRIVYVSCNPATLARDAAELVHTYKYVLKKVGIMNMFPHTSHIEAMAVFEAR